MSYRGEEETTIDRRIDAIRSVNIGPLPAGFSFIEGVNANGEPTLNVVHEETGRVVLEGL